MASQVDKTEIKEREAMEYPTDGQSQVADLQIYPRDQRDQEEARDRAPDEELHIEHHLEEWDTGGFLVMDPSVRRHNPTERGFEYQLEI